MGQTLGGMAKYTDSDSGFPTAEDGVYTCALIEVDVTERKKFESQDMEPCIKWVFETTEVEDQDGYPYKFFKKTGVNYGHEKAALTILIDAMFGRHLSAEEFEAVEISDLKASNWRVSVTEDEDKKTPGKFWNSIVTVKPLKADRAAARPSAAAASRPKAVDPDEDELVDDPFDEAAPAGAAAARPAAAAGRRGR